MFLSMLSPTILNPFQMGGISALGGAPGPIPEVVSIPEAVAAILQEDTLEVLSVPEANPEEVAPVVEEVNPVAAVSSPSSTLESLLSGDDDIWLES